MAERSLMEERSSASGDEVLVRERESERAKGRRRERERDAKTVVCAGCQTVTNIAMLVLWVDSPDAPQSSTTMTPLPAGTAHAHCGWGICSWKLAMLHCSEHMYSSHDAALYSPPVRDPKRILHHQIKGKLTWDRISCSLLPQSKRPKSDEEAADSCSSIAKPSLRNQNPSKSRIEFWKHDDIQCPENVLKPKDQCRRPR
ncbi:hypothetical protein IWX50DRAFT_644905 [Phyllosticta citricarpa]